MVAELLLTHPDAGRKAMRAANKSSVPRCDAWVSKFGGWARARKERLRVAAVFFLELSRLSLLVHGEASPRL